MTVLPYEEEAEDPEGFRQRSSQWRSKSLCRFCEVLQTMRIENRTFSDLPVRELERVRRIVLTKLTRELTGELTGALFTPISPCCISLVKQRPRLQLGKTAPLIKALCEFLTDLDRIILGHSTAAEGDDPHVKRTRYDRDVRSINFEGLSRKRKQHSARASAVEFCHKRVGYEKPGSVTGWDSLPNDIHENILQRVDFQDLFRSKGVSKAWRKFIEGDAFRESRGTKSEGSFTGIHYYIKNQSCRCSGYDLHSKSWKALPPFSYLPFPDAELFKEYSVCGHGALMCADVSKLHKGELVVFNPLTGKTKALPPLLYPRNPVLLHIWVDSLQKSYKVIVAGSTASSQNWRKPNCRTMEVFDSSTSKWKETCNIPGPSFGLSKHQTGVVVNGILFFISYLEGYRRPRGDYVLAWDMENWRYLENWVCPISFVPDPKSLLQLVENDGKVYLFSESKEDVQGQGFQGPGIVCHRIDEMEFQYRNTGATAYQWRNVVDVRKTIGQGIRMYPCFQRGVAGFVCLGFGKGKLCIFNTLDRDGVVYDMLDGMQCEVLEPPPAHQTGDKVFSLNPASFTLHPSFASDP